MLSRRKLVIGSLGAMVLRAEKSWSNTVSNSSKIALITVPYDSGGTAVGTARAPAVLRKHHLLERLREVADVTDFGDVPIDPSGVERDRDSGVIGLATFLRMLDAVQVAVLRALTESRFPILIGGDCPILLGGLAAIRARRDVPGMLFVDGHEDAYAPHESPSGETADMEYGFAVGIKTKDWAPSLKERFPLVRVRDAVLIAHRDAAVIAEDHATSVLSEVPHYDATSVARAPAVTVRAALKRLSADVSAVWLHTDLDALSTEALAAIDYKLPGGLTWSELRTIVVTSLADSRVIGWDVTIYNPDLDPHERSASRIVEFIVDCVREKRRNG
jgi:arginase